MIKNIFYSIIWVFVICFQLSAQTAVSPEIGDGSEINPFQIKTLENLCWIAADTSRWKFNYIQLADINAASVRNWYNDSGWLPIGSINHAFTGSYNGKNHIIDSLFINRPDFRGSGFFGRIYSSSCVVESLRVTNCSIVGFSGVGGLVGEVVSARVAHSFSSGVVKGAFNVGGLIGVGNKSYVECCYSSGMVNGGTVSGGLVGSNFYSKISNSYSFCEVSGDQSVGGLVGDNSFASIANSYSTGKVTGESDAGGLSGSGRSDTILRSFWDIDSSYLETSAGGTGKTTVEMRCRSTFTDSGWDFIGETVNGSVDIWGISPNENHGYPFLKMQGYKIHQEITFDSISPVIYGCGGLELKASASSGLPVTFTSSDTGIVRISGTQAIICGVGSVVIKAIQIGDNYYFPNSVSNVLTVNKKRLMIQGLKVENKVYDGTDSAVFSRGVLDSVVQGDTVTLIGGTCTFSDKNTGEKKVVTIKGLTLGGVDSNKYYLEQPEDLTADISPAPLTIIANNVFKKLTEQDPPFTVRYEGFIPGEDSSLVEGLVIDREVGDTAGTYEIRLSGASAVNYNVKYVNGSLTIEAPVAVRMKHVAEKGVASVNGIVIQNNPVSRNATGVNFFVNSGEPCLIHVTIFDAYANVLYEKSTSSFGCRTDFNWNLHTKKGKPVTGGVYLVVAKVEYKKSRTVLVYKEKLGVRM